MTLIPPAADNKLVLFDEVRGEKTHLKANYVGAVFNDLLDNLEATCRPLKCLVGTAGEVVIHFTKCYEIEKHTS